MPRNATNAGNDQKPGKGEAEYSAWAFRDMLKALANTIL